MKIFRRILIVISLLFLMILMPNVSQLHNIYAIAADSPNEVVFYIIWVVSQLIFCFYILLPYVLGSIICIKRSKNESDSKRKTLLLILLLVFILGFVFNFGLLFGLYVIPITKINLDMHLSYSMVVFGPYILSVISSIILGLFYFLNVKKNIKKNIKEKTV